MVKNNHDRAHTWLMSGKVKFKFIACSWDARGFTYVVIQG